MPPKKAAAPAKEEAPPTQMEAEEVEQEAKPEFGSGKFEYINQTIYIGEWKLLEGKKVKHGQGKISFPGAPGKSFGQEEYDGAWSDDKMHGQGRYVFTSGAEYEGTWDNGKMHGFGKMVYPDGTLYEGNWDQNMMHGEGLYVDADRVTWQGIFVNGSFESKIQKKLKGDKELQDRIETYKVRGASFFTNFADAFAKSDKKTFKDNLSPFFATADTCIDFVQEPYTKYEERPVDKWNEIFKSMQENGNMCVLAAKEESHILDPAVILVEQMRTKIGGQLIEVSTAIADKTYQLVICELPSEQWVIINCSEKV